MNQMTVQMIVKNPKLWWPVSIGEPNLYCFKAVLRSKKTGEKIDEMQLQHGIREVRIIQDSIGEEGSTFTIEINGVNIYAKGSNWVPADGIPARVSKKKYDDLISYAKEANFNILRVWGGGFYEDPVFYNLCNENGIMVWQDFMYACIFYADDDADFMQEAEREARLIVKSLRNHPSMIFWC